MINFSTIFFALKGLVNKISPFTFFSKSQNVNSCRCFGPKEGAENLSGSENLAEMRRGAPISPPWGKVLHLFGQSCCEWRQRESQDGVYRAPDLEGGVWGNEHYILLENN